MSNTTKTLNELFKEVYGDALNDLLSNSNINNLGINKLTHEYYEYKQYQIRRFWGTETYSIGKMNNFDTVEQVKQFIDDFMLII